MCQICNNQAKAGHIFTQTKTSHGEILYSFPVIFFIASHFVGSAQFFIYSGINMAAEIYKLWKNNFHVMTQRNDTVTFVI